MSKQTIKVKSFFWKNREFSAIKPAVAAEALEKIRTDNDGSLKPALVVESARNPKSPLHSAFPWDDSVAAQIGRESIAARLIRSIKVVVETAKNKPPISVRAFVSVQKKGSKGGVTYSPVRFAMEDEQGRSFILRQAWLALLAWRRKYAHLSEMTSVMDAIDLEIERRRAG